MNEIFFSLSIAPVLGLVIFTLLTKNARAHLKSVRDVIVFFFWPYPPRRMLVVRELDGSRRVFYDGEFEIVKSKDKYLIKTSYGERYLTDVDPEKVTDIVSMYEARGPRNIPSPLGLTWRWAIAAAITIFFIYYAVVAAWIPPPQVRELYVPGYGVLRVAEYVGPDPWVAWPVTLVFSIALTWMLVNIQRMADRTVEYMMFISMGINPPHEYLAPALSPDSKLSVLEYAEILHRDIVINIPREIKDILEEVKEKAKGSLSLAAAILAKLAMIDSYRKAMAEVLLQQFILRKAGETMAEIRLKALSKAIARKTAAVIAALVAGIIIGAIIGFVFGSTWTVSTTPPPWWNQTATTTAATQTPRITPATQPQLPITTTTTTSITPAMPPPPPFYNSTTTKVKGG